MPPFRAKNLISTLTLILGNKVVICIFPKPLQSKEIKYLTKRHTDLFLFCVLCLYLFVSLFVYCAYIYISICFLYIYCYTVGFHGVRRIASCDGTYRCINTKCPYLLSYKKENKKNFKQKSKADVVCLWL